MGVTDYFKKITSWTAEEARTYIQQNPPGSFNLVDVRQPGEYEREHLPGSRLIPLGELEERQNEIEPSKPTIVYCASGGRSRAASAILERSGFSPVYNMSGGIHAWQGLVAEGLPDSGAAYFASARSPAELAALSWALEENTRKFYLALSGITGDKRVSELLQTLAAVEDRHKATLKEMHARLTGSGEDPVIPWEGPPVLEGGADMDDTLRWAEGGTPEEILELAIALESNAYDRYLKMIAIVEDEEGKEVFRTISAEEKVHLGHLTALMDKVLLGDFDYGELEEQ